MCRNRWRNGDLESILLTLTVALATIVDFGQMLFSDDTGGPVRWKSNTVTVIYSWIVPVEEFIKNNFCRERKNDNANNKGN